MTTHKLLFSAFLVSCFYFLLSLPVVAKTSEEVLRDLPQAALAKHVRPRFQKLKIASKKLDTLMHKLCLFPDTQLLQDVSQAFEVSLLAFAGVEHLRFGPMIEQYRFERLHYWPDRKGRGRRALHKLLKAQDEALLEAGSLAKKSIAVQGLGALEYILYGKGAETILEAEGEGSYRCRFGAAITANVSDIANEIAIGWGEAQETSQLLLSPGSENPQYKTRKEVIQEFYKSAIAGLKSIHDLKMNQLLGSRSDVAKPKRAAFWRSGLAVKVLKENIKAIEDLVWTSGFAELLAREPFDLKAHALKVFQRIYKVLDEMPPDIEAIVRGPELRPAFMQLMKHISHLSAGFARQFSVAADLPLGFNALDGD